MSGSSGIPRDAFSKTYATLQLKQYSKKLQCTCLEKFKPTFNFLAITMIVGVSNFFTVLAPLDFKNCIGKNHLH